MPYLLRLAESGMEGPESHGIQLVLSLAQPVRVPPDFHFRQHLPLLHVVDKNKCVISWRSGGRRAARQPRLAACASASVAKGMAKHDFVFPGHAWRCRNCDYVNRLARARCHVCADCRPTDVYSAPRVTWSCVCEPCRRLPLSAVHCPSCERPVPVHAVFKAPEGWQCRQCARNFVRTRVPSVPAVWPTAARTTLTRADRSRAPTL